MCQPSVQPRLAKLAYGPMEGPLLDDPQPLINDTDMIPKKVLEPRSSIP